MRDKIMTENIIVKIIKSGNRYNAFDINGRKWTSSISTSTRKNAYRSGTALMRTSTSTGKYRWTQVPLNMIEAPTAENTTENSLNQTDVVKFIHTSYSLKPQGLVISELKWKHLIRSVLRGKNILITGPKGTGKTLSARAISSVFPDRPVFDINLGSTQDPRASLIGNTQFNKKQGTFFSESSFVKAIKTKNAIIRMDEISRAHPEAWNILMTVLDEDQRYLRLDEEAKQTTINVAEGVTFIATANIGIEYTSTRAMDAALLDRFTVIEMDVLNKDEELALLKYMFPKIVLSKLDAIASIAEFSRKEYNDPNSVITSQLSTRTSVEMASMLWDGFSLTEISEVCVYPEFSADGDIDSERTKMSQFVQKFIDDNSVSSEDESESEMFSDDFIKNVSNSTN